MPLLDPNATQIQRWRTKVPPPTERPLPARRSDSIQSGRARHADRIETLPPSGIARSAPTSGNQEVRFRPGVTGRCRHLGYRKLCEAPISLDFQFEALSISGLPDESFGTPRPSSIACASCGTTNIAESSWIVNLNAKVGSKPEPFRRLTLRILIFNWRCPTNPRAERRQSRSR